MNEKTLRALADAGAIRRVCIVANGARFHIKLDTATDTLIATTGKGTPRTFRTLDASARWVRRLGLGSARLDISHWQPDQRSLAV